MRKSKYDISDELKIIICDDEQGIIDSLTVILHREGCYVESVTDPNALFEKLKKEHFDMLILDYLMEPMLGDEVVKIIREFSNIYIMLLTGHKDLAPPRETMRNLEIQAYAEKSDKFDDVLLKFDMAKKYLVFFKQFSNHEFSEILVFLRKQHGYSQDEFARRIGLSRNTVSDIEKGKYIPRGDVLVNISRVLGVSVDYMLGTHIGRKWDCKRNNN